MGKATCKTCGAEVPNHVPSLFDGMGIGNKGHRIFPPSNEAADLSSEPQTSKQASPSPSETQLTLQNLRNEIEQEINAVAMGADRATMPENLGILIPSIDLQRSIDRITALFTQALTSLRGEMEKKKRELVEPVTQRPVTGVGDKVGIDLEADTKGSLKFIQDNGFNMAISECQRVIGGYLK